MYNVRIKQHTACGIEAIATVAQSAKSTQARSGVLTGKGKGQAAWRQKLAAG